MVYPGESSVITRVLLKRRQKCQSEGVTTEAEVQRFEDVTLLALKMEEGYKPGNVGSHWMPEKTRKQTLPWSLQKEDSPVFRISRPIR